MDEGVRDGVVEGFLAACETCVSRRAFLAESAALTAVAAFFAACTGDQFVAPSGPVDVKVSDFPGLATTNQLVLIDSARAAKRTGASTFAAWSRACTHEGTRVNLSGSGFQCPNHGARFDNNGNVTLGPASRPLVSLPTSYDAATDTLTIG
jgi:cytochrome b6-f complex iron-sulfur subunit